MIHDFIMWLDAGILLGCLLTAVGIGGFIRELVIDCRKCKENEVLIDKLLADMKSDAEKRKTKKHKLTDHCG